MSTLKPALEKRGYLNINYKKVSELPGLSADAIRGMRKRKLPGVDWRSAGGLSDIDEAVLQEILAECESNYRGLYEKAYRPRPDGESDPGAMMELTALKEEIGRVKTAIVQRQTRDSMARAKNG